jgi:sarcosine oxidase
MIDGPDGGMKIAYFDTGIHTSPNAVDREVHSAEVEAMRVRALQLFPALSGPLVKAQTCFYSTTPDAHFVIGALPDRPQVAIAVGFSGR